MRSRLSLTILLALAVMAALPAAASASANQYAIFQDDSLLVEQGDAVRDRTLDELDRLGVDVIKAQLSLVVRSRPPAAGARAASTPPTPPSTRAGRATTRWCARAQARGFRVMFALSPPYPGLGHRSGAAIGSGWTVPARGSSAASPRPPPCAIRAWTSGRSATSPTTRSSSTRSRAARACPRRPTSTAAMVRSAVAGFNRAGAGGDTILFGELLPIGKTRLGPKSNLRPLLFLREFFCLNSRMRPYRGRAARVRDCRRYRALSGLDGFAYHPYTRPGGPRIKEPTSDDATIRSLGRITRLLDGARRRGRIGGRRLPIWSTEFGYQSNPPDRFFGARLSRIPGFLAESELLLSLRNRRVASYSQYTMTDTAIVGGDTGSWQGGLRFAERTAQAGRLQRLPAADPRAAARPQRGRGLGRGAARAAGARSCRSSSAAGRRLRQSGRTADGLQRPRLLPRPLPDLARRQRRYRFLSDGYKSRAARPIVR